MSWEPGLPLPPEPASRSTAARVALLATLAATVLGLLSAAQIYYARIRSNEAVTLAESLFAMLPGWYFWALATPLILWLGRRFPINARKWPSSLPVHLVVALLLSAPYTLLAAFTSYLMWATEREAGFATLIPTLLLTRGLTIGVVFYFALLGLGMMLESRDRARTLTAELAQAQVRALQMQLHPHFLFNTLHAIRVLVREDPAAAERTLTLLGDLLRQTLAGAEQQTVPLKQELSFLGLYLDIEKTRFSDRLQISFDVEPTALDLPVPNLILQPLVENAIRHGVAKQSEPGRVVVRGRRSNGTLELSVQNDGPPLGKSGIERVGIGLATTRERLSRLYGTEASLSLSDLPEGGVLAQVRLPVVA